MPTRRADDPSQVSNILLLIAGISTLMRFDIHPGRFDMILWMPWDTRTGFLTGKTT